MEEAKEEAMLEEKTEDEPIKDGEE